MASSSILQDLVSVRGRYQKSVHLERDSASDSALAGYIITPLVRSVLTRFINGLEADAQQRAWSVTGPYGTGKSAMALLWANLVGKGRNGRSEKARRLLEHAAPDLLKRLAALPSHHGFVPVLATGERTGLDVVLLGALSRSLEGLWSGRGAKPTIRARVEGALQRAERGRQVSVREVIDIFEEASRKVQASTHASSGLLVILDEAGKCLEYAAHQPTRGDVQLLQELAEAANRSGNAPILFVTILHQSVERYASRLGAAQRNEWAKVQGRFEDIPFQEDPDQLLKLVASALERTGTLPPNVTRDFERLVDQVVELAAAGDDRRKQALRRDLCDAFPLHPVTALALGPLFRSRLAQNERSLFSFLCSGEPLGFRAHLQNSLRSKGTHEALYTVDRLYDYLVAALGSQLFAADGRQWAELDTALRRLPRESDQLEVRALKVIGLLSSIGDGSGLRPSSQMLNLAIGDGSDESRKAVTASLETLLRSSVVVHRKYRDAYQIWEGSDLNLDDLVRAAHTQTDTRVGLAGRLAGLASPRPLVARRHLFQTGTLRYFDVTWVEAETLWEAMQSQSQGEGDGSVLIALPRALADVTYVRDLVTQKWTAVTSGIAKPVVVGIPRNPSHLSDLAADLSALEWVRSNTPELAKDPIARRELNARIVEAQKLVREEVALLLGGGSGGACEWFYRGERLGVKSSVDLSRRISEICDQTYDKSPVVRNELINRRNLSSAAAAARRNLMEAMLTKAAMPRLGFEGFPPEISMYRSVLEEHGMHRKSKGEWCLTPPSDPGCKATWNAISEFLAGTEERRRSLSDLYRQLAAPPFGIKEGLVPVLVWAALIHLETDVALYEQGAFVPGLSAPIMERMLRFPDKFELQRFKIAGVRAQVFERFGRALLSSEEADHPTLLSVVKALVKFVSDLPDFARTTKRISSSAQEVRNTLVRAKEPGPLLFQDLPVACDCQAFEARAKADTGEVERFFSNLRRALSELQSAYPLLLEEITRSIRASFELTDDPIQPQLAPRAARIMPLAGEAELKAFLIRAADGGLAQEEWLISLATYLATKPPARWNDTDFEAMQAKLTRLAHKFRAVESLAVQVDRAGDGAHSLVRLSITRPHHAELERVITIADESLPLIAALQDAILAVVQNLSKEPHLVLAALAQAAQGLLEPIAIPHHSELRRFDA